MELMSGYDCKFVFVKGEDNTVVEALSRLPSLSCSSSDSANASASHPFNSSSLKNPVYTCPSQDNPMSAIFPDYPSPHSKNPNPLKCLLRK